MDKALRRMLLPLALTQFIASFAGSNMNVAISSIAKDIGASVHGVQIAITMFLLTMAALMITGSKLTDIWGRKYCLTLGLVIYGTGAVLGALAQGLPLLITGYSIFEGVGSALMIPPVYILTTALFTDITSRAKAFGAIMGAGGVGAAAGPLIGGIITTGISWRASFLLQAIIVAAIVFLARKVADTGAPAAKPRFDLLGAVLSALGMFFIVLGIIQASTNATLLVVFMALGAAVLWWFFLHIRAMERRGEEPLLRMDLFRNRESNLAMVTQNVQWLLLMGTSLVVSVFLQVVRGYSAIQTGVIFTAATVGVLISSALQGRFAERRSPRALIASGFILTIIGIALLLIFARATSPPAAALPGLFVIGFGVGGMLTPSVNVVQSAFPDSRQGEISGLCRSISNLGSSFGTAIGGAVLALAVAAGNRSYGYALIVLGAIGLIGLAAAFLLPGEHPQGAPATTGRDTTRGPAGAPG
jgi:MFS family permease